MQRLDCGRHLLQLDPLTRAAEPLPARACAAPQGYEAAKQKQHVLDLIKWGADYLIKCHVDKDTFVAQVGNVTQSHQYWLRPEDMIEERPAFTVDPQNPGTDVLAATAAALAATSAAFLPLNREYAGLCLNEALSLYQLGANYLGSYSKVIPTEGNYYSESYYDDLAWAAAWINKVSGSGQYLKEAENWCADCRGLCCAWLLSGPQLCPQLPWQALQRPRPRLLPPPPLQVQPVLQDGGQERPGPDF